MSTWFESLFGFRETSYEETQRRFEVSGTELRSLVNERSFGIGAFSTPTLASLRDAAGGLLPGRLRVEHVAIGDILELHAEANNEGALFQVASQFNCLEFPSQHATPEDGVTQYQSDGTQGPACSLAAAAATVYRNYFVEIDGERGQRRDRQLNNLDGVQAALGTSGGCIEVRNGYTFADAAPLERLNEELATQNREALMAPLKIGLQTNVEVTFAKRFEPPAHPTYVSQAFCSALSCGYSGIPGEMWAPLATLVLDAAYEATLLAAIVDATRGQGSAVVWLTFLGGGVFQNDPAWIGQAIRRALERVSDRALEVRVAHYRRIDRALAKLIDGG